MRYTAFGMALCAFLFAADEKMLFDYRSSGNPVPPLAAETQRKLLSAAFPHYLRDVTGCKADEQSFVEAANKLGADAALQAARNSGQVVPQLLSCEPPGPFTRSGARQLACLIEVGECGAEEAGPRGLYGGTYRLAVFENGRLIASAETRAGISIDAVADVDNDGIDEILMSGCGFGQGILECSATLLSMAGGSLKTIREFPYTYTSACSPPEFDSIEATEIRYAPGRPPQFFEHRYKAACPAEGQKPAFKPAAGDKF
jgi:hypothetical protein